MSVGLARDEPERLLDAAERDGPRSAALITLLAYNGLRIDEALSRDVSHLGHQLGHRVLRISRKGGHDGLEPCRAHARDLFRRPHQGGQLAAQRATALDVERLIDRLVRNPIESSSGKSTGSRLAICSGLHAIAQRRCWRRP